jgi:hypothetical protein
MAGNNRQNVEQEIKDLASIAEVAFKNIADNIKDVFEDVLSSGENVISSLTKDMAKNINSLAKDSNKLIINQSRIDQGLFTSKDISKQILANEDKLYKLEQQRASTVQAINDDLILSETEKQALIEDINKEYEQSIDYNKILVDKLKEQAEQLKLIEKRTGITAKILTGLKKIPILGDVLNIDKGLENMRKKALETDSTFKILGSGIKGAFEGIEKASIILAVVAAAKKIFDFIKDAMFAASKQIANFQRNLAVSRDNASEIRDRFFEISDNAKVLAQTQEGNLILQKDLVEAQESFNTALGLAVDLSTKQNEEFAAQFTNVKKFYDLNEQEQKGLINLYTLNGKTVNETKTNILGQVALFKINTKEAINVRKVYKEILTTSNATKLSIKGGSEALTQAVINAQKLGVSLDSLGKIADNLLNFEQSISSELEAELITGRDLNLERARAAALMNDQVTLTEEVNRLVKDAGPDFEQNRVAMQASANAIGISVEELADMITQQKAVEKFKQSFNALDKKAIENSKTLSEKEKKRLLDGTAGTREYYKLAKEQGKDLNTMLGEEMATRLEAQDAQQKFNDALEKAKETFSRFVDGGYLDKLADIITGFVDWWNGPSEKEIAKKIEGGGYGIETKNAYSSAQRGEIMYAGSGPKFAEGGIVTRRIDNATIGEAGPEAVIPLNQLMNEFKEMKQILTGILNKEGTITLNGTKMGTAMAVGGYKVQ